MFAYARIRSAMPRIVLKTQGERLLTAFLKTTSQAELAAKLHVSQQTVSDWALGKSRPKAVFQRLLQTFAAIPSDAWLSADERRRIKAA